AEAMALADRIAVLDGGELQQMDTPRRVYEQPATAMVADFVGRGMLVDAQVLGADGDGHCQAELLGSRVRVRCDDPRPGPAKVCLRTEQLRVVAAPEAGAIQTRLIDVIYRGPVSTLLLRPDVNPQALLRVDVNTLPPALDSTLHVSVLDAWRLPG
ncbi:MAG: TOBE domain-containing protein, partial [Gammaproteobacteria bacterium]|nr:TOBE domain-containing protein [Gammaproteobacteria bacterium]